MTGRPLEGVRVLTIEQFGAAPYGSMFLAALGADVVKIENPDGGGDPARHVGPYRLGEADSLYFQTWHANKRSVRLDLKSEAGRRDFERLVAGAHAVMNNLRGDQPAKLGLDYASLAAVNPAVVCLHVSAYGRDNERAASPGYDFLMQAESGLMSLTGEPDGPPSRLGASFVDYMTGLTGVVGLLSCLWRARETGKGADVDASLFDVALHQLGYAATWYLNEGMRSTRQPRSAHLSVAPSQTFPTADGWVFVMCMTEKFWRALVEGVGRPDLLDDPRFADGGSRQRHRAELTEVLDAELCKRTSAEWIERLSSRLPIGPVLDLPQALDSPFVARSGMITEIDHALRPGLRVLASPLKIDGERPPSRAGSALGADDEALLAEPSDAGGIGGAEPAKPASTGRAPGVEDE